MLMAITTGFAEKYGPMSHNICSVAVSLYISIIYRNRHRSTEL